MAGSGREVGWGALDACSLPAQGKAVGGKEAGTGSLELGPMAVGECLRWGLGVGFRRVKVGGCPVHFLLPADLDSRQSRAAGPAECRCGHVTMNARGCKPGEGRDPANPSLSKGSKIKEKQMIVIGPSLGVPGLCL